MEGEDSLTMPEMSEGNLDYRYYLGQALEEALQAQAEGQNPIGSVITDAQGRIIARGHNRVSALSDLTAHAEMRAIHDAFATGRGEEVRGWTLYTTMEPCPMCLGTIVMSHIGTVVWAAPDRHIQTHRLLDAIPYLRSKRLRTVACPDLELEQRCSELHDAYWIAQGKPEVVQPLTE
jgi:tRNA(adenine34) deaminase